MARCMELGLLEGYSALIHAIAQPDLDYLEMVLNNGVDVNAGQKEEGLEWVL